VAGKVLIYTDGGSRGNPGIAGSGTVVYSESGEVLREIVYVVGKKATNNVAEYHGMLRGLEAAADLGASVVEVRMDSKLVVEQMSGRWKIKHPAMQELAVQARRLMERFDAVTFTWVPRARNKEADHLSNVAMDAAAAGHAPGIVAEESSVEASLPDATSAEPAEETAAAEPAEDTANGTAGTPSHWTGATATPTRFVLLRHGQTTMNAARQYSGRTDTALTEVGVEQAQAAARLLGERGDIDVIVSSPLARCVQTAEAAGAVLGLEVEVIDDLIELDFGDWEGKTFDQAHARDPELHDDWITDPAVCPPNGETLQALHRRIRNVRRDLVKRYEGTTILVVSHVTPIKSFLRQALDAGPQVFSRMFLDVASISVVEFYAEGARIGSCVRTFNETSHLR